MEYEKPFIYIDTNFSADEAMMLAMTFDSYDYEIVGISTNSGVMSPMAAAENIVAMSADAELFLSVAAGDRLDKSYDDISIFSNTADYVEEMPAYENIIDKADDCGRLDIITTGPLTNIAKALEEAPEIEDYISHIFILGGSLAGEISPNFSADPLAIDAILNTSIDLFIIPDEVSQNIVMDDSLLADLGGISETMDRILEGFKDDRSLAGPLLLYLTQTPEAFIFEETGLRVDTKEEAGALRRDDSRKKNYMVNKVNEESFYDFLRGSIQ